MIDLRGIWTNWFKNQLCPYIRLSRLRALGTSHWAKRDKRIILLYSRVHQLTDEHWTGPSLVQHVQLYMYCVLAFFRRLNCTVCSLVPHRLAMTTSWRTFHHDGKISPVWWGCTPSLFHKQSCGVRSADTLPLCLLYPYMYSLGGPVGPSPLHDSFSIFHSSVQLIRKGRNFVKWRE
jgi:hypothetical protein